MDSQLRRAYLVGAVVGLAVTALAVAFLIATGSLRWASPSDEEERPPVVVSNGSVKVAIPTAIKANKRGEFRSVAGFNVYRHTGDNENKDKTVETMDLEIEGASACTSEVLDQKAFTIVTTMGEIEVSLRARGASGSKVDVLFTFGTNVVKQVKHRLVLADHKLQAVKYGPAGSETTCTFDDPNETSRGLVIWPRTAGDDDE